MTDHPLPSRPRILCVGELLWDALPAGLLLGGAPFNVAAHLHALGADVGIVSRVGGDRLGTEAVARVARRGVATDLIQVDDERPTGFVAVSLDSAGEASYDILAPAAWDAIEPSPVVEESAAAGVIVFGSLAQRGPVTRDTVWRLLDVGRFNVFDVNLRPPHDDPDVVRHSLEHADLVKLNGDELAMLGSWYGLPEEPRAAVSALAERFGCGAVCVTLGREGAVLLRDGRWSEHPGFSVEVKDTVGSGDAFLARLLAGLFAGETDEILLREANLRGAVVAMHSGAIPAIDDAALSTLRVQMRPVHPD